MGEVTNSQQTSQFSPAKLRRRKGLSHSCKIWLRFIIAFVLFIVCLEFLLLLILPSDERLRPWLANLLNLFISLWLVGIVISGGFLLALYFLKDLRKQPIAQRKRAYFRSTLAVLVALILTALIGNTAWKSRITGVRVEAGENTYFTQNPNQHAESFHYVNRFTMRRLPASLSTRIKGSPQLGKPLWPIENTLADVSNERACASHPDCFWSVANAAPYARSQLEQQINAHSRHVVQIRTPLRIANPTYGTIVFARLPQQGAWTGIVKREGNSWSIVTDIPRQIAIDQIGHVNHEIRLTNQQQQKFVYDLKARAWRED